jgi:hypothetical protein
MKIIFLFIMTLIATMPLAYETPTKDVKAEDMVDPQLARMDKKVWQNLLQVYANIRMVAKTTLKDMQAVSNFAWSAQRQLQAVENAANKIEQIYTNIKGYRGDNVIDFITYTEEKVFQQTDQLVYYDIPNIQQCNKNLLSNRDEIASLGKDQAKALAKASVKSYEWFEKTFFYAQKQAQADPRMANSESPGPARAVAEMTGTIVSENIAGADIRNQNQQNQGAMLSAVVGVSGGNGGDVPLSLQAQIGKDNNRNNLILTLQENDLQNSAIQTGGWYLMLKARQLDKNIVNKALLVSCAKEFAQEVQKISSDERFVRRK